MTMGYFDRTPFIADNDCYGKSHSVRIVFSAGHSDDRDRRSFLATITTDGEEQARFHLPYTAARELIRALQADMRRDLERKSEANEIES